MRSFSVGVRPVVGVSGDIADAEYADLHDVPFSLPEVPGSVNSVPQTRCICMYRYL